MSGNDYRIVVGVSDRSKSPTALRWAQEAAGFRGGSVVAVRAWRPPLTQPGSRGTPEHTAGDLKGSEAEAREQLHADVAEVLGADHGLETRLVIGSKRRVLLAEAQHADLLVIDSPRRLDLEAAPGFLQRLLHSSTCPVVVVPRVISGAEPTRLDRAVDAAVDAVGRTVAGATGRGPRSEG